MNSKVSFRVYLLLLSWGNLRFGLFVTQTYLTKALSVDWHKVLIFREGHKKSLKNHKKIYYVAVSNVRWNWKSFLKFCGLLRIYELYKSKCVGLRSVVAVPNCAQSHYREVPRWGVSNGARHNWKCFLAYKIFKKVFIFLNKKI